MGKEKVLEKKSNTLLKRRWSKQRNPMGDRIKEFRLWFVLNLHSIIEDHLDGPDSTGACPHYTQIAESLSKDNSAWIVGGQSKICAVICTKQKHLIGDFKTILICLTHLLIWEFGFSFAATSVNNKNEGPGNTRRVLSTLNEVKRRWTAATLCLPSLLHVTTIFRSFDAVALKEKFTGL